MTTTDKSVQRMTRAPYMVLFPNSRAKARAIVIAIGPGELHSFAAQLDDDSPALPAA